MASLTSRLGYLAALTGAVVIALRPPGAAERGLQVALSPVRLLTEVAAPIGLLRARSVRAAERRVLELREEEDRERRELGADQRRYVLPQSEELRAGRHFTIAEVVRRVPGDADRLEVRIFPGPAGQREALAPGQPVVVGDHYIGRLKRVDADAAFGVVELITRPDVFVGGRVETPAGPARLVIGGLQRDPARRRRPASLLAVHSPSRFDLEVGLVRVDEGLAGDLPFAAEAEGFELGRLRVLDERRGERLLGVQSLVNLAEGVFQMAIVGPARRGPGERSSELRDPLDDSAWVTARALSRGDPVARCEGLKLSVGTTRGVRSGAAVVAGARLVGRVVRAGLFGADARLVGDPGFALPVVARIDGEAKPLILGTLVSLGRLDADPQGRPRVAFHWEGVPLDDGASPVGQATPARLFTGAGAEGVPPGLILGDTLLERDGAAHGLAVTLEVDPRALGRLRVRLAESASGAAGDPAP